MIQAELPSATAKHVSPTEVGMFDPVGMMSDAPAAICGAPLNLSTLVWPGKAEAPKLVIVVVP